MLSDSLNSYTSVLSTFQKILKGELNFDENLDFINALSSRPSHEHANYFKLIGAAGNFEVFKKIIVKFSQHENLNEFIFEMLNMAIVSKQNDFIESTFRLYRQYNTPLFSAETLELLVDSAFHCSSESFDFLLNESFKAKGIENNEEKKGKVYYQYFIEAMRFNNIEHMTLLDSKTRQLIPPMVEFEYFMFCIINGCSQSACYLYNKPHVKNYYKYEVSTERKAKALSKLVKLKQIATSTGNYNEHKTIESLINFLYSSGDIKTTQIFNKLGIIIGEGNSIDENQEANAFFNNNPDFMPLSGEEIFALGFVINKWEKNNTSELNLPLSITVRKRLTELSTILESLHRATPLEGPENPIHNACNIVKGCILHSENSTQASLYNTNGIVIMYLYDYATSNEKDASTRKEYLIRLLKVLNISDIDQHLINIITNENGPFHDIKLNENDFIEDKSKFIGDNGRIKSTLDFLLSNPEFQSELSKLKSDAYELVFNDDLYNQHILPRLKCMPDELLVKRVMNPEELTQAEIQQINHPYDIGDIIISKIQSVGKQFGKFILSSGSEIFERRVEEVFKSKILEYLNNRLIKLIATEDGVHSSPKLEGDADSVPEMLSPEESRLALENHEQLAQNEDDNRMLNSFDHKRKELSSPSDVEEFAENIDEPSAKRMKRS